MTFISSWARTASAVVSSMRAQEKAAGEVDGGPQLGQVGVEGDDLALVDEVDAGDVVGAGEGAGAGAVVDGGDVDGGAGGEGISRRRRCRGHPRRR
jgi:hypothetical protein